MKSLSKLEVSVLTLALATSSALSVHAREEAGASNSSSRLNLLNSHVAFLASDALGGRMTGTSGASEAANYLAKQLAELGGVPLVDQESMLVPFEYTAGARDTGSTLTVLHGDQRETFNGQSTMQALSFSDSGSVTAPVVFAGYGLSVPESQDFGYDSYATLDVTDKIVVVLRYVPEDLEGDARATLNRYSGLRYKAMTARDQGAKAIVVVTGPNSPNAGKVVPMTFDTAAAGSGIVAASISGALAEKLFAASGKSLAEAQTDLDTGNPHATGFALDGVELTVDVAIERQRKTSENVLALFEGSNSSGLPLMIGAHYDHLGRGNGGNSLASPDERGDVHNGADDNASGVAATLEALRWVREKGHERDLLVGFWAGEELGLLGATAYVNDSNTSSDSLDAYLNLDMVGRMRNNKLTVQAVGTSPIWKGLLERSNVPIGFDIQLQDDPYLPTDSSAFNQAGVPTLNLFTGSHSDYHKPSDDPETINYEDLSRVAHFTGLLLRRAANDAEDIAFTPVERKVQRGGDRDTVRAYTGTIPDYGTEIEGLLLGGVIEGGPAEAAGLAKGDVIVQFGERKITNIYDYTYALDAIKIDVPLEVVYIRDGERKNTTLIPKARP